MKLSSLANLTWEQTIQPAGAGGPFQDCPHRVKTLRRPGPLKPRWRPRVFARIRHDDRQLCDQQVWGHETIFPAPAGRGRYGFETRVEGCLHVGLWDGKLLVNYWFSQSNANTVFLLKCRNTLMKYNKINELLIASSYIAFKLSCSRCLMTNFWQFFSFRPDAVWLFLNQEQRSKKIFKSVLFSPRKRKHTVKKVWRFKTHWQRKEELN